MSTPAARRPASRYGSDSSASSPLPKKPGGIAGKIIAVVAVLVVIAVVLAVGRYMMNRNAVDVSAAMVSHERIDDETMRLWVDVTREDTTVPSYCIVTSLNYGMAEVGRREFLVPAGGETVERFEVDIPSRDLPVSGGVYGCSTSMPSYLTVEE